MCGRGRSCFLTSGYERFTDQLFLPGGGLESGETLAECCTREIREETGFLVLPKEHFLTLNEYYGEYRWISHFFTCEIVGEEEQSLTDEERERGLVPVWMAIDEAIDAFGRHEEYRATNEEKRGAYLREYTALTEWRKNFAGR